MTGEEFRADLLAAAAAQAEAHGTSLREGFASEVLERLRDAGEVPDAEPCAEIHTGQNKRRLEIDAFAFDDADDSLHLFVAMRDGGTEVLSPITLTEARDQGFNRLLGLFEQAREGWLAANLEESRPLWALAHRIQIGGRPAALRLHVLTDRPMSERLREIKTDRTKEAIPVTFQIWDATRLKRIHEAHTARDDLFVDFSKLPGGGLSALPAGVGFGGYDGYIAVIPGEVLADIYLKHGSRLLEGNVRTFLGRRGSINKGIATTLSGEPERFFAYNNGIAATATEVYRTDSAGGSILLTGAKSLVSKAPWYEGGYRAQVVAYAVGRLSALVEERSGGGRLDYLKVWATQTAGDILERQLLAIAETMMDVLRSPPLAGQNVSEWAKQQACRKKALETAVPIVEGFDVFLLRKEDVTSANRNERNQQRVTDGLQAVTEVMNADAAFWGSLKVYAKAKRLTTPDDDSALTVACAMPRRVPTDWQAARLLTVKRRCEEAGFA